MINQPRPRHDASIGWLAFLMLIGWIGLAFAARFLADTESTAGLGAFVGFFVIALSVAAYVLFMMAVDSDKS